MIKKNIEGQNIINLTSFEPIKDTILFPILQERRQPVQTHSSSEGLIFVKMLYSNSASIEQTLPKNKVNAAENAIQARGSISIAQILTEFKFRSTDSSILLEYFRQQGYLVSASSVIKKKNVA